MTEPHRARRTAFCIGLAAALALLASSALQGALPADQITFDRSGKALELGNLPAGHACGKKLSSNFGTSPKLEEIAGSAMRLAMHPDADLECDTGGGSPRIVLTIPIGTSLQSTFTDHGPCLTHYASGANGTTLKWSAQSTDGGPSPGPTGIVVPVTYAARVAEALQAVSVQHANPEAGNHVRLSGTKGDSSIRLRFDLP